MYYKKYYAKQPMKMLLHLVYNLAQTKTVINKWLANSLFTLFHIYSVLLLTVSFVTNKMNSFSMFFSSPLLDVIPSNNTEPPDDLDMLLEILSESNIQFLNSRVTKDLGNDKH